MNREKQARRRPGRVRRGAAIASLLLVGLAGCDSEPQFDPEQERNIRPGQREEGTPRDEEN